MYTVAHSVEICGIMRIPTCLAKIDRILQDFCKMMNLKVNSAKSGILFLDKKTADSLGNGSVHCDLLIVIEYRYQGIHSNKSLNLASRFDHMKAILDNPINMIRQFVSASSLITKMRIFDDIIDSKIPYCPDRPNKWARRSIGNRKRENIHGQETTLHCSKLDKWRSRCIY